MLSFRNTIRQPSFNQTAFNRSVAELADKVSDVYATQLRIAIVRSRAIATGKTLNSVKSEFLFNSPSRGQFRRRVTARNSWFYIQAGRAANRKPPPLSAMLEWFTALNIPRPLWFPILKAIGRRGIKPRRIQDRMMRASKRPNMQLVALYAERIARDMFTKPGAAVQVNKF